MIARLWRGQAPDGAPSDAYLRHVTDTVFPSLRDMDGHRGAWLLRRTVDGCTEFIALTLWESSASVEAFAGPDISKAVVEPEARAVLSAFDDFATHYEVAFKAPCGSITDSRRSRRTIS
jgi:heme-degrading monooxygenase HmoA